MKIKTWCYLLCLSFFCWPSLSFYFLSLFSLVRGDFSLISFFLSLNRLDLNIILIFLPSLFLKKKKSFFISVGYFFSLWLTFFLYIPLKRYLQNINIPRKCFLSKKDTWANLTKIRFLISLCCPIISRISNVPFAILLQPLSFFKTKIFLQIYFQKLSYPFLSILN